MEDTFEDQTHWEKRVQRSFCNFDTFKDQIIWKNYRPKKKKKTGICFLPCSIIVSNTVRG